MSNTEYGTPPDPDGTWQNQGGSPERSELKWRYIQLNALQSEISKLSQFIQKNIPSDHTGHDSGDEDPKAWSEKT